MKIQFWKIKEKERKKNEKKKKKKKLRAPSRNINFKVELFG